MIAVKFKIQYNTGKTNNQIDAKLRALTHVKDFKWLNNNQGIEVTFDPNMISAEDIRRLIQNEECMCSFSKAHTNELCCTLPDKRRLGPGMKALATKSNQLAITSGTDRERVQTLAKNFPEKMVHDHTMMAKKDSGKSMEVMDDHEGHKMAHNHMVMTRWQQFKMNMNMTMDMDHGGGDMSMLKMMENSMRFRFYISLLLTIPVFLYSSIGEGILQLFGIGELPLPLGFSQNLLLFTLATPVVLYGGWMFFYGAFHSLRKRSLNMSVLIAVGIGTAFVFSVLLMIIDPTKEPFYEAASMLVTFVLLGHWMEMRARRGTSDSMRALFDLVPPQARLWKDGQEVLVPTSQIQKGDTVIVKPGDKVPIDGIIVEGESSFDESLVTGESLPVLKEKGMDVIGGSINQSGSVKIETTRVGSETALGQIMDLVQNAQNSKAPGQRLADKFAGYLVIIAVGAGLITFSVWYFLTAQLIFSLTFAISAVVIACPDALGLATPTAVAVGTGLGAKYNILIKDAATLENVSNIDTIMFDKTGTLTEGEPKVTEFVTVSGVDKMEMLTLMASVEAKSSHPLSKAVVEEAINQNLKLINEVQSFENLAGRGVQGVVKNKKILIGNKKALLEQNIDLTPLQDDITRLEKEGNTILIMAQDDKVVGVAGAADKIKPSAYQVVSLLHEMQIEVGIISGDNEKTAKTVADKLGIDIVFAEVLPSEKADYVAKLQSEGKKVAMVGDGVNDAPALAKADVGIAIGAGTDVAIETAKIILMKSDPLDVIRAIRLSKATVKKMKQNLGWASIYNLLAIPVAAGILYPVFGILLRPEFAALLMSLSSIIVASNAILLKRSEKDLIIRKPLNIQMG